MNKKTTLKHSGDKFPNDKTEHLIEPTRRAVVKLLEHLTEKEKKVLEELHILDKATALKRLLPEEFNRFIIRESNKENFIESNALSNLYKLELGNYKYLIEVQPIEINFPKEGNHNKKLISSFGINHNKPITVFEYKGLLYILSLKKIK